MDNKLPLANGELSRKAIGQTVSDEIGDEYKKWSIGDIVMISAPTGKGKTHFRL